MCDVFDLVDFLQDSFYFLASRGPFIVSDKLFDPFADLFRCSFSSFVSVLSFFDVGLYFFVTTSSSRRRILIVALHDLVYLLVVHFQMFCIVTSLLLDPSAVAHFVLLLRRLSPFLLLLLVPCRTVVCDIVAVVSTHFCADSPRGSAASP